MTAPASSIRLGLCREGDVRALMRFISDEWAKDHILSRDEALLRWQYDAALRGMADSSPPSVLLAWRGERIVGTLGMTYMRWLHRGSMYAGAWTSHWLVVPELRTSHVALLLIRRAAQLGLDVLGGVGVRAGAAGVLSFLGYESIAEIPRWVAVIEPVKTAALLVATGIASSRHAEVLASCRERTARPTAPPDPHSDWEVTEWRDDERTLADEWDACWERDIAPGFVGVVRDTAYIRWRYLRHPSFRYRVSVARDRSSGRVGGIVVSRLEAVRGREEKVLRIGDLLVGTPPAAHSLLQHLMRDAKCSGVAFADFYCSRPIEGLAAAGFAVENAETDPFILPSRLQPLEPGGRPMNAAIRLPAHLRGTLGELASCGALYLTKSDADQDRPN